MSSINACVELYDLMAKRFAACGRAPHQAKVYAETRDFIAGCATVDESMKKIKNSKYYTAPAQALMLDKFAAYRDAARANKLPELEKIYDEKYKEVEQDWMKAYEMGYEKKVAGVELRLNNQIDAFNRAYTAYIELLCCGFDKGEIKRHQDDLIKAFTDMNNNGEPFGNLAAKESFRALVPANDMGFKKFVMEAPQLVNVAPDRSAEEAAFKNEFNRLWPILSQKKAQITEVGKGEMARVRYAACIAIPPKDKTGKYEFDLREEEMP